LLSLVLDSFPLYLVCQGARTLLGRRTDGRAGRALRSTDLKLARVSPQLDLAWWLLELLVKRREKLLKLLVHLDGAWYNKLSLAAFKGALLRQPDIVLQVFKLKPVEMHAQGSSSRLLELHVRELAEQRVAPTHPRIGRVGDIDCLRL
jgi:hypothetical protein